MARRPVLRRPGLQLLDQAGDAGDVAEGALHHRVRAEPALEVVAQGLGDEQRGGVGDRVEAPDQQRIVVGDEAERVQAGGLHAAGDEQAEGLVGVAAGEAVEAEVVQRPAREGLGEEVALAGQAADLGLEGEPVAGVLGQAGPGGGVGEERDDAVREQRRCGELGAHEHRDLRRGRGLAGDLDGHLAEDS